MSIKVKIEIEKDKDYKLQPVNGVSFSNTPNGDIVVEYYVEHRTSPSEITLEVFPEGNAREVERVGERNVRNLMGGLVVRPDLAYAIGEWLQNKAKAQGYNPPEKH